MSDTPETQVSKAIAVAATDKAKAAAPDSGKPAELNMTKGNDAEFKVADLREDGTVILELGDGRMFPAEVAEGVTVKRRNTVVIKADGVDKDDVPVNPVVSKVV